MGDIYFEVARAMNDGRSAVRDHFADAARELAGRYYGQERDAIYRYLVSLGTNPSEAQDLTQESFLKLYIALRNRKQIENARAWLFTAASNLAMNQRRWWKFRPSASDEDMERWARTAAGRYGTPEQTLLNNETATQLAEAVRQLSQQQRACLQLRREGFRYREIARILGVSLPTVAEFVRRAVAKLKKAMNE